MEPESEATLADAMAWTFVCKRCLTEGCTRWHWRLMNIGGAWKENWSGESESQLGAVAAGMEAMAAAIGSPLPMIFLP